MSEFKDCPRCGRNHRHLKYCGWDVGKLKDHTATLERQLAEAREFKCPKCKEVLTPYIDEDEFYGDRLSWFCACEPRDLPIIENQLKEKEQ